MELRPMAMLLLLVCAVIFTTTEGSIPKCCVSFSSSMSCQVLKRVQRYEVQDTSGSCDIYVLILHMKNKMFCADRKYLSILKYPKKSLRKWVRHCKKQIRNMS